jgi:medium-chain acyl-[acyl-carrier-protein] hydrolase
MLPIWRESFTIKSYDVDSEQRLKLPSLFCYLQEVAGNHAENLGVGSDYLESKHLFWVLSRIKLEITRMPKWNEEIHIETWPKGIDKLFALREFLVYDSNENILISGTSCWLLLDNIKYRLHKIEELGVVIPDNGGKTAIHYSIDKIVPLEGIPVEHTHYVTYSELDMSHHVNNTRYASWITDCFEPAFFEHKTLKSIHINYLEEAKYKETIVIKHLNQGNLYYFEGQKQNASNKVFQALVEWI